jgi:hypothetical protein
MRLPLLLAALAVVTGTRAVEPNVTIRGVTPKAVIEAMRQQLEPQGFVLGDASDKEVVFTYDRGMVAQSTGPFVHVYMDLHARFKATKNGLQVVAFQEFRGAPSPNAAYDFRRPFRDRVAMEKLQHLLETVRDQLEGSSADSSSPPQASP